MRHRIILFGYLAVAGFLVAHLLNAFVSQALTMPIQLTPPALEGTVSIAPLPNANDLAEEILSSGLFPKAEIPVVATVMPAGQSSLNASSKIRVLGTVVGDGVGSLAVLQDVATQKQRLYRIHQEIPDLGDIEEIRKNGVLIRKGSQREFVELVIDPRKPSVKAVKASVPASQPVKFQLRRVLDRREVEQSTADLPKLLSQARAVPNYSDGNLNGWRIELVKPNSMFQKLGLQKGDVVQRINGVEVRDPGMMLTLFQQVKNEQSVSLDMLRSDRAMTVTYEIR